MIESLEGSLKINYTNETTGGAFDDQTDFSKTGVKETFNQHFVSINEASRLPKFKWWIARDGDYSKGNRVEYTDVLTIGKKGIEVKGNLTFFDDSFSKKLSINYDSLKLINENSIKINSLKKTLNKLNLGKLNTNITVTDKKNHLIPYLDNRFNNFTGNLEIMQELKAGTITDGYIKIEKGKIFKSSLINSISADDITFSGSRISSKKDLKLETDRKIEICSKNINLITSNNKVEILNHQTNFSNDVEILKSIKAGSITDGYITIEKGMFKKST